MIDVFQYPKTQFPEGFLWGCSTSGQQIEGSNNSFYDDPACMPQFAYGGVPYEPAGKACNSYEQYEDDIELIKRMHLSIYRMSLEWSRIEPEQGTFDDAALQHYLHILKRLKEEGIRVCLTIHHMSHPVWFHKAKAFQTMDQLADWERYIHQCAQLYSDYVDYWIIINEMNLAFEYSIQERINLLQYHARGYHILKEYSGTPASSTLSYSMKVPYRGLFDKCDCIMADYIDYIENEFFIHAIETGEIVMPFHDTIQMPELKDTCDYWALNTYIRQFINSRKKEFRFDQYKATHVSTLSQPFFMEEICPDIMIQMLMRFRDRPIMITENGIACEDDRLRIVYISAMLQAVKQGIDLGAKVIGYLHWSLLDNWEWGITYPTFGLASVDPITYKRTLKQSGEFYGEIAKHNGYDVTLIQQYLTESQQTVACLHR